MGLVATAQSYSHFAHWPPSHEEKKLPAPGSFYGAGPEWRMVLPGSRAYPASWRIHGRISSSPHAGRTPAGRAGPRGRAVGDGRSQRTRGRRDGRRGRTDLGRLRLGAAPPGAHCRWVARFPQAQARRPLLGWAGAPLPGGSTPDVAKRSALNETRSRMATTAQTAPRLGTTPRSKY